MPLIPISAVVTPTFLVVAFGFTTLVLGGFLLDGWVARRWPILSSSGIALASVEEALLRLTTGIYFLALWDARTSVLWRTGEAILTPEVTAEAAWIGMVQFAVAVLLVSRRTCILAATGIGALYIDAVRQYGVFHMTDYTFFPGMAAYLALTSIRGAHALRLRLPILSGSLAFGLMWTAIEKFLYPQWTLSVVFDHPSLSFGFDPHFVVVVAGFVEFSLAFFIMLGRGLMRFGAAGFMAVFLGAIPEFGHLDAVGHISILGILGVVLLHGASPLQKTIGILDRDPLTNAGLISMIYVIALACFFAMYYSLHSIGQAI